MAWIPAVIGAVGGAYSAKKNSDAAKSAGKSSSSEKYIKTANEWLTSNLPTKPLDDPYLNSLGNYYNQMMAPNYQAYSDQELNDIYKNQSNYLISDVFKPQEEKLASRLAQQGLAGSGTAQLNWGKQLTGENRALADMYSGIQQYGRDATRSDVKNAANLGTTLSSMYQQNQYGPINYYLDWISALQGGANREAQSKLTSQQLQAQSAAGWGQALSSIASIWSS